MDITLAMTKINLGDYIMSNVQVRVDENLKTQAQAVAASMGLDLASTVRMFLAQMVKENALPFRPTGDPFYSPGNQARLKRSVENLNNAQNCSAHDLLED